MDWHQGFTAAYYACMVDPSTWGDKKRIEITGGNISRVDSDLKESADIACVRYREGTDKYIRIWMDARQNGKSEHVPLFTGMTSKPKRNIDGLHEENRVQCYSVLKPAQDVLLKRGYYAAKGFKSGDEIKKLLRVCPAPVDVENGSPRLAQHIVAEEGETCLSMVYRILNAIGWRLVIDGYGNIKICPKASRPVDTFDPLKNDIIEPQISVENDWFDCPNVFRAVSENGSAEVKDESDSDLSVANRGREVWKEETNVSLAAGETLLSYATRRLGELQGNATTASYKRRYKPNIRPSDLVRLNYPAQELSGVFYVESQKIELGYGATTSEEVRQA